VTGTEPIYNTLYYLLNSLAAGGLPFENQLDLFSGFDVLQERDGQTTGQNYGGSVYRALQ